MPPGHFSLWLVKDAARRYSAAASRRQGIASVVFVSAAESGGTRSTKFHEKTARQISVSSCHFVDRDLFQTILRRPEKRARITARLMPQPKRPARADIQ